MEILNKLECFESFEDFDKSCFHRLLSYHWENEEPYRPPTYCKLGIIGNNIFAQLKCYEKNPKSVFENRDDPIYKDSCLEFFVKPLENDKKYINVECNSKGVFLCEIGEGKYDRLLVKDVTRLSPLVEPFFGEDYNGSFWGVTIELSKEFIKSAFKKDDFKYSVVECNFYKCGDDCVIPHYIAYAPVSTLPPGFHNPDCFRKFMI